MRCLLTLLLIAAAACPAFAGKDWTRYSNARFGYSAEVPPDFMIDRVSDNGDGARFRSTAGSAGLSIFGSLVADGTFAGSTKTRIDQDREDGWTITYEKVISGWASYSGTQGLEILYVHGVALCDGKAAYLYLHYPREDRKAFDGPIARMVKSLRPAEGCATPPHAGPGVAPAGN